MGTTLNAKRIKDALQKAKQVGRIEESVTISGCSLVLQNLIPDDYSAIIQSLENVPESEYVFAYQRENIARSLIEIEGEDFRNVAFIEDEIPKGAFLVTAQVSSADAGKAVVAKLAEMQIAATVLPPSEGDTRTIKVERHEWLSKNVLNTWTKEALTVCWRKFAELLQKAETNAKDGIQFQTPDETAEEKMRRALSEVMDALDEVPESIANRIFEESGLLRRSSVDELEAAQEELASIDDEAPSAPPAAMPEVPEAPKAPPMTQGAAQALMQDRARLNEQYTAVPAPPVETVPAPAQVRAPVPAQIRKAALENTAGLNQLQHDMPRPTSRYEQTAALEQQLDPGIPDEIAAFAQAGLPQPEITDRQSDTIDPKALSGIIDRPPAAGINPRFKRRF